LPRGFKLEIEKRNIILRYDGKMNKHYYSHPFWTALGITACLHAMALTTLHAEELYFYFHVPFCAPSVYFAGLVYHLFHVVYVVDVHKYVYYSIPYLFWTPIFMFSLSGKLKRKLFFFRVSAFLAVALFYLSRGYYVHSVYKKVTACERLGKIWNYESGTCEDAKK
jgi:hypothetical protein